MLTALSTICLALSPVLAAPTVYNEERRAWAAHKQQQQIFEVRGGVIFAAI